MNGTLKVYLEDTKPVTDREERVSSERPMWVLLIVSLGWLFIQIGREVLPPLLPTITGQLSITDAQAGFVLTLLWGTYALFHYPGGRFADEGSLKFILIGSLGLIAVGFMTLAIMETYSTFLIAATVIGAGTGLFSFRCECSS
jgi:fucose permease